MNLEEENKKLREIIKQHDLCHDLHGKVGAKEFAMGCEQEQRKLYGCAPHADQLERANIYLLISIVLNILLIAMFTLRLYK